MKILFTDAVEDFKNKLTVFIDSYLHISVRRFEEECKLPFSTVASIKVKGPSADALMKISNRYPELNMNWLLGEEDNMITVKKAASSGGIPLLPFSAVAGFLAENTPIDTRNAIERYVIPEFSARGADCAIRVDGDSMYPRYSSGEVLAIRIIKDPTFFQWGRVYVLSTNQGCVIKKLFPDPDDPDGIICHSENTENYPDYKITKQDIFGVAIVVGHAGIE